MPIDAAGTSILQASQLLAYIALFRPQVLILDEPDSHLHPDNQRALCDVVSNLAKEKGFQAIISTHSRHVLNTLRSRGKIIWISKGAVVDQTDISTTAVLLELGALDSVDYFADGELRCVVATEDTNQEPLKALLWSNDFVEDDTEVASYAGCSKADAAIVLGSFLSDKAPHVQLAIHRDRDYQSAQAIQTFVARLTQRDIHPLVTTSNDVEAYFVHAAHLAALNPQVAEARVQELINQATAETRAKSIEALVNMRTEEAFRIRQAGGPQPNHGAIAVQAAQDYDADPAAHRRGKVVLGRLIALLQQEIAQNPRVYSPTQHLRHQSLVDIAHNIWPPAVVI